VDLELVKGREHDARLKDLLEKIERREQEHHRIYVSFDEVENDNKLLRQKYEELLM
jgi:uncharacterized protein (UPF0335 family)